MTNVERVERDIAREKMFREAFMNGKEPTDEDRAAWALADALVLCQDLVQVKIRNFSLF